MLKTMQLESTAFKDGDEIPQKHGYRHGNVSIPLTVGDIPDETVSLALVMDDPDAMAPAGKVWVHWLLWNVDPAAPDISENTVPKGAVQGKTDFGEAAYGGPAPPDKRHTYVFKMYALDVRLDLSEGSIKKDLLQAIKGHILAEASLRGTYAP